MNYWQECISEALDEAGIKATSEQIASITEFVQGAHENYGAAHGHDCIPNPLATEMENMKTRYEKRINELEHQQLRIRQRTADRERTVVEDVTIQDGRILVRR